MINPDIPGQMSEEELAFIARLAKRVPVGGRVLELGSLFGRSSWTWAKNVDQTATIFCVDPWKNESWIAALEKQYGTIYSIDTFHKNTAEFTNIVALPGYSPNDLTDWNLPLDVYFDDSVHTNPTFRENLDFWISHVKPGGILCGHDYSPQFPDIVSEVQALVVRLGARFEVVGSLWMIELPMEYRHDSGVAGPSNAPLITCPIVLKEAPSLSSRVGSMMKSEELQLLFTLASDHYLGSGEIIDIGPFLGSSTIMLAKGLAANPRKISKIRRIFSFDRFLYEPYVGFDLYINKNHLPTSSFFGRYLENIIDYIENIYLSPGDILNFNWNKAPVELLFIDAAKNWSLNNHIVQQFFGALISNHSIVLQQDYFYYGCPWIIITMEQFSPWLQFVGSEPGATAYFQSRATLPQILVRTPVNVACNLARQSALLDRAIERHSGNQRLIMELARIFYHSNFGNKGEAAVDVARISRLDAEDDKWLEPFQWNLLQMSHHVRE